MRQCPFRRWKALCKHPLAGSLDSLLPVASASPSIHNSVITRTTACNFPRHCLPLCAFTHPVDVWKTVSLWFYLAGVHTTSKFTQQFCIISLSLSGSAYAEEIFKTLTSVTLQKDNILETVSINTFSFSVVVDTSWSTHNRLKSEDDFHKGKRPLMNNLFC